MSAGFVEIGGFPAAGEWVAEIAAFGGGFVAVGYADNPTDECPDQNDGRIWTSGDGQTWTRRDGDTFAQVVLSNVAVLNGRAYAFGYLGLPGDCPVPDHFGNNVWRSSDGVNWERITSGISLMSEADRWNDVAVAGDALVAVGYFGEAGDGPSRGGAVWISRDGVAWQAANRNPLAYELVAVAAMGDTVVAFSESLTEGLAWYSLDGGINWSPGTIEGGYVPYSLAVTAGNGLFVAATSACCGLPGTQVGVTLVSTDGRTWMAPAANVHRHVADEAVVLGDQFVVLGAGGEVRASTNGIGWKAFTAPASGRFQSVFGAAAGDPGVVMVVSFENGLRSFFARRDTFAAAGGQPQPPQPAEIGTAYQYRLYTHCGTEGTRVLFDGGVWLVEDVESGPFRNPEDAGQLTKLSADSARYTNSRGGSILLTRAAIVPPWPECA